MSVPDDTAIQPADRSQTPALDPTTSSSFSAADLNGNNLHPENGRDLHKPTVDNSDSVLKGKEKAHDLVSSTLHPTDPSQPPSRPPSKSPVEATINSLSRSANATPQSRKRSRSGSRIVHNRSPHHLPSPPSLHDLLLRQYIHRDQAHSAAKVLEDLRTKDVIADLSRQKRQLEQWTAERHRDPIRQPTQPIYPSQRRRPFTRRTKELRISRKDRKAQAEQVEELVPIRLDIEHEKLRLRDTFTWNVYDQLVPPELFAQGLVEDFKIPIEAVPTFTAQVYQNMQEQIEDFHPHTFIDEGPLDPHLPYSAYKNDELRVAIKLNVTIGQHTLVDQFDWDINNPLNSPEEFARQMANDLGLSGEFMTAIAHCIREQTQLFTKALYVSGHPFDGRAVEDADVRDNLLPSPLASVFRPFFSAKEFAPYFYELNEADLERQELVFSREQRQQKRSAVNRRGGPSLPDLKDRLKTWRTLVIQKVIPGEAEAADSSGLYRIQRRDGRGRRPWKAEQDDSEISESDDSEPESPTRSNVLQGTSRTRGMRGAASAAQAAMRANLARSATPEFATLHHHETRTLPRKLGYEIREDSESSSMLLRLKMPRERFRQWWRDWKAGRIERKFPVQPPTPQPPHNVAPGHAASNGTPHFQGSMGPPPPTPGSLGHSQQHHGSNGTNARSSSVDQAQPQQKSAIDAASTVSRTPKRKSNALAPGWPSFVSSGRSRGRLSGIDRFVFYFL